MLQLFLTALAVLSIGTVLTAAHPALLAAWVLIVASFIARAVSVHRQ